MSLIDYAQFGVAIFALGVLAYLVDKFLKFMTRQEENFKNTIDNHLKDHSASNRNLATAVRELLDFLKHQNSKK